MIKFRIDSRTVFNVPLLIFSRNEIRRKTFDKKNNSCFTRTFSPLIWRQDLYLCGWPHKGISGMLSITVTNLRYLEGVISRRDAKSRNLSG